MRAGVLVSWALCALMALGVRGDETAKDGEVYVLGDDDFEAFIKNNPFVLAEFCKSRVFPFFLLPSLGFFRKVTVSSCAFVLSDCSGFRKSRKIRRWHSTKCVELLRSVSSTWRERALVVF